LEVLVDHLHILAQQEAQAPFQLLFMEEQFLRMEEVAVLPLELQ
jgi:hypothetical protein